MLRRVFLFITYKVGGKGDFVHFQMDYLHSSLATHTFYIFTETRRRRYMSIWKKPGVPWFTNGMNLNIIDSTVDKIVEQPTWNDWDSYYVARGTFKYGTCTKNDDERYKSFTMNKYLSNTHYPNVESLVSELNSICLVILQEIGSTLNIAIPEVGPFTCKNKVVSFVQYDHFDVKLTPFLTKLLHMSLTREGVLTTQTGTQAVELGIYERSHVCTLWLCSFALCKQHV